MYANNQTAREIAREVNSRWSELALLTTNQREEAIAALCRETLDGPSARPRIVGDLSDPFTRPDSDVR